jgi:hypothetical protein
MGYEKPGVEGAVNLHQYMARVHQAKGENAAMVTELEKAQAADKEGKHPGLLFDLGAAYATQDESKKSKALSMLKAFHQGNCKGGRAALYKAQCEQTMALIAKLGGSVQ